jgi:polysaccharide biosynthesis protein PelE
MSVRRIVTAALVATTAVVLESLAIFSSLMSASSDRSLLIFLFQHAVASLFLAAFVLGILPARFRQPRLPALALLFCFSFFIPLLGLIGILTATAIAGYRRRHRIVQPFTNLTLPEFVLSLREPDGKFSQGGIKARLAQASIPAPQRLQSLLALQGMPARVSSPLLQSMLGDTSEDIRLVAYGLLDSREKKITSEIHRELANLKTAEGKDLRLICLRHLAELYWELVYAGLTQGDLRLHALHQSLSYVDDALQLAPQEQGLWFLKGRVLHELKRNDEAYAILEQAMANGLPESRVLPYIVEIAFDRGDYRTVRRLLARISISQVTPIMKGAIHFWVKNPAAEGA